MDYQKIVDAFKAFPLWLRLLLLCALAVGAAFYLSSCANTKALIRTSADNTQSSVTITTNNPTNVTVTNSVDSTKFNFNPKKSN